MNQKLWLEITLIVLFSLALLKPQINGAPHQTKRQSSSITVVGRVLCKTCSVAQSYFIPGAQVGVACSLGRETGETDSRGMFRIELPSDFTIDKCTVQLLGSSLLSCNVPFLNNTTQLSIKSRLNSHFVYRAAPLSFRPPFCKKHSRFMSSQGSLASSKFDFPFPPLPPITLPPLFPPFGDLPPIPFIPIPPISLPPLFPPFGNLPPIPFWPPLPDVPINPPPPPPVNPPLNPPPPPIDLPLNPPPPPPVNPPLNPLPPPPIHLPLNPPPPPPPLINPPPLNPLPPPPISLPLNPPPPPFIDPPPLNPLPPPPINHPLNPPPPPLINTPFDPPPPPSPISSYLSRPPSSSPP